VEVYWILKDADEKVIIVQLLWWIK